MEKFDDFFKVKTKIVLEPTIKEFNVARDIHTFLPTKEQGGKIHYLDENIVKLFGNITIKGREDIIETKLVGLVKKTDRRLSLYTRDKFINSYKDYNIFDAIELTSKIVSIPREERPSQITLIFIKNEVPNYWHHMIGMNDSFGKIMIFLLKS